MDIYSKIKNMKIQGASEIAVQQLLYLKDFSIKHGFGKDFEKECRKLMDIRKTAVVSYNVINQVIENRSLENIVQLVHGLRESRQKIAKNTGKLFKAKKVVMTHCHSHEASSVLIENSKKIKEVYVTETRPFNQGLLTANDLKSRLKVNYIVDSAEGFYMPKIDFVLLGADALRKQGVVNKIGTLQLCILAKEFRKPVYVAASSFKIDTRKRIDIEFRDPKEIVKDSRQIASLRSVKILNPVFDITPYKYISKIITEKGIVNSSKLKW